MSLGIVAGNWLRSLQPGHPAQGAAVGREKGKLVLNQFVVLNQLVLSQFVCYAPSVPCANPGSQAA